MIRPSAVWKWDGANYIDYSDNIRVNTTLPFLSAPTETLYLGSERRFEGILADLSVVGSYTGLSFEYYSSKSSWVKLSLIDSYNFDKSKYLRWLMPYENRDWQKVNFTSEFPQAVAAPDTKERYWIRITCTAVITQAVISYLRTIPYAQYATPTMVSEFCQFKKDFGSDTHPTDLAVEDMIRRKEDKIDYKTAKSWRFNAIGDESYDPVLVDFNRYGVYLRHRNFTKVYGVYLWNGGGWDTLNEGRTNDYFVDYDNGIIYLTRLFMLPAVYGITGKYGQYNFGEFKKGIKVDYVYGKDSERDREFKMVEDLVVKMTAVDIIRHHDYSSFVVSNLDAVSLAEKARGWEAQIEIDLNSLASVAIF